MFNAPYKNELIIIIINFNLRNIKSVCDSLTDEATVQLVYSFIILRLDNFNSLLYGLAGYTVQMSSVP